VYPAWADSVFLAFFAFSKINNFRAFNIVLGSIPTAPTKPQETKDFLGAESAIKG
jgi:hypothetical protein